VTSRFAGLRYAWPILAITFISVGVLVYFAGQYGLHRDELYFIVAGRHPAFGYVDQPPLTPLLNAASAAVFGPNPAEIRILPALAFGAVVLFTAAIAREFGGGRRAQTIAALTVAVSGYMSAAHLSSTTTYDVLAWTVCLFFVIRALRGPDQRVWLWAGLAAGISLENKDVIVFLAAGLVAGILIGGRRELLRSKWLWAGVGLAFLIWLPNLVWQAANGFPQLEMARAIAAHSGADNRNQLLLIQVLFAGPFLFPIAIAGLWWLLRSKAALAWRPIGWAYLVILALLFLTQGKSYYAGGILPALTAAGSVVVAEWLDGRWAWLRRGSYVTATVASAAFVAVLVLPWVPASSFPQSNLARSNNDLVNQYGWDTFAAQVHLVADGLTPEERDHAAIITANYGEAGALELIAKPGLPPVFSGHNSYYSWGPPDEGRTVTILVSSWRGAGIFWSKWLGPCGLALTIDLGFPPGLSEEQGAGVWVCRGRTAPWSEIWPLMRSIG
jgi:4-amino-4-deoxy-L-arabinose transferase-like glycosyltransferase